MKNAFDAPDAVPSHSNSEKIPNSDKILRVYNFAKAIFEAVLYYWCIIYWRSQQCLLQRYQPLHGDSNVTEVAFRHATHLPNVVHTLADVCSLLCLLGVVGVDEDGGVCLQSKIYHFTTQLGEVRQPPQQLQDL